jgi:uncharacterized SAM-binding protein YcdF (DUF218 family)
MYPRHRLNWLRIGWTIGLLALGTWAMAFVGVLFWSRRDTAQPATAIVVMGAAQYAGHPSPVLRARLDHAIDLWKRHLAPQIIFTGGFGDRDTESEAAVSRRYAILHGIPPKAILFENTGRTTNESLQQVAAILDGRRPRTVILVSDPFHMLRLTVLARRYGLVPYTSPTRTSPISLNRREWWAYVFGESVKVPAAFVLERR